MNDKNRVILHGEVVRDPVYSHSSRDLDFYSCELCVPRRSGTDDVLPMLVRGDLLQGLAAGKSVTVEGTLRSYNNQSGVGRKLCLNVLVDDWIAEGGESVNDLSMGGTVCREPLLRQTPMGRTICDFLLAVPRTAGGRSDYIPVIAWGSTAHEVCERHVGDAVSFEGRFQSRPYRKTYEDGMVADMVAYEVSVLRLSE